MKSRMTIYIYLRQLRQTVLNGLKNKHEVNEGFKCVMNFNSKIKFKLITIITIIAMNVLI